VVGGGGGKASGKATPGGRVQGQQNGQKIEIKILTGNSKHNFGFESS
jgi:hypothetical protein